MTAGPVWVPCPPTFAHRPHSYRLSYDQPAMLSRRGFLQAMSAGLLVAPVSAVAQGTRKIPRLGLAIATSPAAGRPNVAAFLRGLGDLGYVEGQNIIIEERWAEGQPESFNNLISDLLRLKVDLLVVSSVVGARAAKNATMTTPVVFVAVTDPAGTGVVSSLARPGGNLTGTSLLVGEEFAGKWVELVKETLPQVSRIAALSHTDHPMARKYRKAMETAAQTLGLTLQVFDVRDTAGLDGALSIMTKTPPGALIVPASPFFGVHRRRIAGFALPRGIPTIGHDQSLVVDGILMSYGPSIADSYRRGAVYVDKILKGAKPADLPVEQPTKFELVINLKTAKALGLTIPPSLLLRADQVIE
jgi:putative ABC transport system substrate-binding protein